MRPLKRAFTQALVGHVSIAGLIRPFKKVKAERVPLAASERWSITRFGLGYLDDRNNFSIEYTHQLGHQANLETDPANRRLVLSGGSIHVWISYFSISSILIVDSSPTEVILSLQHAPFFGRESNNGQLARESWIDSEHASLGQAVNRQVLVAFADGRERRKFCDAHPKSEWPRPVSAPIQLGLDEVYAAEEVEPVELGLGKWSVSVALQMHSLLLSGLATPHQISTISNSVTKLEAERGPQETERVLLSLADTLHRASLDAKSRSQAQSVPVSFARHLAHATRPLASVPVSTSSVNICMMRYAVVTPTGIDLAGPFAEQSNATLRLFPNHIDHFLRVSFRDEDHSCFSSTTEWGVLEFLRRRFRSILVCGLRLAGRTFEFVGWSAAGLKDQTALFVTPFEANGTPVTAASIRSGMGTFAKCERIPAKWMARVGQNFSTSKHGVILQPGQVTIIDDIAPPDSPWVFTDGVGTISPLLAQDVQAALDADATAFNRRRQVPGTCFQVRVGGAKGMLSVDPTLEGLQVCLRPSMVKFEAAGPITLNVANEFSRPSPAFANRPLVQVLEGLDVPAQAFVDLQQAAIRRTEDAKASWAGLGELLRMIDLGRAARVAGSVEWLAVALAEQGSGEIEDAFLQQCAELAALHSHRQLKFKARVPFPGCWTLVGIIDEEPGGFLKENEIYACIHEPGKEPVYLEGIVAISRSPVVHPGDVRLVKAIGKVDPAVAPFIAYQRNCVVFPVKGSRPLPSMLGGGDCDGDMYQIITDPALLPKRVVKAGGYDAPKSQELARASTVGDAADFFLNFGLLDCVSRVSMRHLYCADSSTEGVATPSCTILAKAHSVAIDFPKTGVAVSLVGLPPAPIKKPDFSVTEVTFARHDTAPPDTYRSQKALGRLFRMIGPELVRPKALTAWNLGEGEWHHRPDEVPACEALDSSGVITRLLEAKLEGVDLVASSALRAELDTILRRFTADLHRVARTCSLTREPLSEPELLLSTIASADRGRTRKKECSARLAESTRHLFVGLRREVGGGDRVGAAEERVRRLWAGWGVARDGGEEGKGEWGRVVAGWVVLGALLEAVENLESHGGRGEQRA